MRSILPASKHALLRHLGVAGVAALLAAVWGGASAQTVPVLVTVQTYGTTPTGATCGPTAPAPPPPPPTWWICVNPEPVPTPDVDTDTNVAILWTLDTATANIWHFDPSEGIYMKSKKWVTVAGPGATPSQYIAVSLKENGNSKYHYKIHLLDTNGKPLAWDPTIRN